MVVSDQLVLCKAALIFAVTRWLLSFALNLLTTSMGVFSPSSSDSHPRSNSSSSANLRLLKGSLSLTTFGEMEPEGHEEESCAVCLNRLRKSSQVWELSSCCHVFHKQCLERWVCYDNRLSCPICRASLIEVRPLPESPSWAVDRMLYLFGDDLLP